MLVLNTTKSLVRSKFQAGALHTVERIVLDTAAMKLQATHPGEPLSSAKLSRAGNYLLQTQNDAMRLFFAVQSAQQDADVDTILEYAHFLQGRAEQLRPTHLGNDTFAALADTYSFVIETAIRLKSTGSVSARRKKSIEVLIDPTEYYDEEPSELFTHAKKVLDERNTELV